MNLAAAPSRPTLDHHATNDHLATWIRVWIWCWSNSNPRGHAPAYPGQIRADLGITAPELSRAIRLAREHHVIDPCSTAGCLVLPGHALAPCDATHREGQ